MVEPASIEPVSIDKLIVKKAHGWWSRLRGLLGRTSLPMAEGLWLKPCASIHTVGMMFVIDVVFLDKDNTILGLKAAVIPFQFVIAPKGCTSVLELAKDGIEFYGLKSGDSLNLA